MTTSSPIFRVRACWVLTLLLALNATPSWAHDYWLEFQPLAPDAGDELSLSLWVGEDFVAEAEKAMQQARTVALRHHSSTTDEDLLPGTREGATPIVQVRLAQPGGHLFALERDPSHIELRALKFNRYLKHEGLTAALAERKQAGERLRRARERYHRNLKAFVQVGDAADGISTKVLGHPIELVPERDLATLRPGDRLGVQLRFEGKPLAGAKIEAFTRTARGAAVSGQAGVSDENGRVEITIDRAGAWVLRTVHMRRCAGCTDAEWESFWTSYSFAVRS